MNVGPDNNCGIVPAEIHGEEFYWRCPSRGEHFSRCGWCGSMCPEELVEYRRSGGIAHVDRSVDRKYGYPHKIYVDIKNSEPDTLFCIGGKSEAKEGPYAPGGEKYIAPGPEYIRWEDLTSDQMEIVVRDGWGPEDGERHLDYVYFGKKATFRAKFYSIHLADPKLDPSTKDECESIWGYRFDFGERLRWYPYDYSSKAASNEAVGSVVQGAGFAPSLGGDPYGFRLVTAAPVISPVSPMSLISPETLKEHYLTGVVCDQERKMDKPSCSCSRVNLGWHPSVGAAVDAWIDHVVEVARA